MTSELVRESELAGFSEAEAFERWQYLVQATVKRMRLPTKLWDDAWSEGSIGLVDAIRRFDPERGVRFRTFAISKIQGRVLEFCRKNRHEEGVNRSGRRIEIAGSLDSVVPATDGLTLVDVIPCETTKREFRDVNNRDEVERALSVVHELCSDRELEVLRMYVDQDLNYRKISEIMGLSESRVYQLRCQVNNVMNMMMSQGMDKAIDSKRAAREKKAILWKRLIDVHGNELSDRQRAVAESLAQARCMELIAKELSMSYGYVNSVSSKTRQQWPDIFEPNSVQAKVSERLQEPLAHQLPAHQLPQETAMKVWPKFDTNWAPEVQAEWLRCTKDLIIDRNRNGRASLA